MGVSSKHKIVYVCGWGAGTGDCKRTQWAYKMVKDKTVKLVLIVQSLVHDQMLIRKPVLSPLPHFLHRRRLLCSELTHNKKHVRFHFLQRLFYSICCQLNHEDLRPELPRTWLELDLKIETWFPENLTRLDSPNIPLNPTVDSPKTWLNMWHLNLPRTWIL